MSRKGSLEAPAQQRCGAREGPEQVAGRQRRDEGGLQEPLVGFTQREPQYGAFTQPRTVGDTLLGPVLALAAITVAVGLGAGPVFDLASRAAAQLSDPSQYIAAVLGPGGVR